MSKEEDDARQYRCLKKYEEIVKQVLLIDELTDSMDLASRLSKMQENTKGGSSSSSSVGPAQHQENKQLFAETITRFLHDLRSSPSGPDSKPSNK